MYPHLKCSCNSTYRLRYWNELKPYPRLSWYCGVVATAPTVYGIETICSSYKFKFRFTSSLQQHLPFTVLKLPQELGIAKLTAKLQQHLPFTVLKLVNGNRLFTDRKVGCNSTYRLRYWNFRSCMAVWCMAVLASCNSTYRLRYWNAPFIF